MKVRMTHFNVSVAVIAAKINYNLRKGNPTDVGTHR